ncbi:peptidase inhibitor family I36 protein [Streptomyces sp. NBC_00029]|uniref:Peptidase inhibitor family I36 protein n=1 Tax=Streptomyces caledonius TaxID=3134107 RepID=A0ABU8UBR9_9ACTN
MNKTVHALRLTAVVAASMAMVFTAAGSSSASQFNSFCEAKEVCIYRDSNLNGAWIDHQYADPNYWNNTWTVIYPEESTNDRASSLDSWDPNWKVRFFTNSNYGGSWQTLPEYGRANSVSYNDQYSSHCWNDGGVGGYSQCDF